MRYNSWLPILALATAFVGPANAQSSITEYPVGDPLEFPTHRPNAVTAGPDGNVWFTQDIGHRIGKITPLGVVAEFTIPTPGSQPSSITLGPDGNLWFTEKVGEKIGKITPAGSVAEYALPTAGQPVSITAHPTNGLLYYTVIVGGTTSYIGSITTAGVSAVVATSTAGIAGIAAGPDGNLWVANQTNNSIDRVTPGGTVTQFLIPSATSSPLGIAKGPDGNLWFTESNVNKIGKITTAGGITEYTIPTADTFPGSIAAGPDGNVWFTENLASKIGRITPGGVITEFPTPTAASLPVSITAGPDGNIWFAQLNTSTIGRIIPGAIPACSIPNVTISNTPWKDFTANNGTSVVWVHAHMEKPGGIPTNAVSTVLFTGGTLKVAADTYPLPAALVTFDPNATSPLTVFNTSLNRWETTVSPSDPSNDVFIGGAALPVTAALSAKEKASVSFSLGASSLTFSTKWKWGRAVYTNWPANWNDAQISPTKAARDAGAPLNPTVQQWLLGGGNDYTGSSSSTGHASCKMN